MEFELNWLTLIVVTAATLFCVLPLIAVALVVFFGATRGRELLDQIVMPDPAKLRVRFERLRERRPELHGDALVQRIINQEALKAGAVGFATGFGGVPTLPITVPIDALASMRIQATMVQFIARAYGHSERSADLSRMKTYLIMAGSKQLTTVSSVLIRRIIVRIFLRSTLKIVPVVGGVVGLIANYLATQAIGQFAIRWYRGDLRHLGLNDFTEDLEGRIEQAGLAGALASRAEALAATPEEVDNPRGERLPGERR